MVEFQDSDDEFVALSYMYTQLLRERRMNKKRKYTRKRFWVKDWLLKRPTLGWCETILKELSEGRLYDHEKDQKQFLRIDEGMFHYVLERVAPIIKKEDTNYRKAITPFERLAITLRYLGSGSTTDIQFGFRVSRSTLCYLVQNTLEAIVHCFIDLIKLPQTSDEWLAVSERFLRRWNMPHVLSSIDGKHVAIKKPPKGHSSYFNYKRFHSIVLLACCDADLRFTYIHAGTCGRYSDSGILPYTDLYRLLIQEDNPLNIPGAEPFAGDNVEMPYYFIGDSGFSLKSYMMVPYSRRTVTDMSLDARVFNYRHSRSRRTIECAFGVLAQRYVFFFCLSCQLRPSLSSSSFPSSFEVLN